MGLFKKKPDPISDRSRELQAQMAALEAQIKQLNSKAQKEQSQPCLRSRVLPHSHRDQTLTPPPSSAPAAINPHEPVFESIYQKKMTTLSETETTPAHYNDLGVRKYDLVAVWRRIQNHLHGPATPNPKLVSYLAAGTIRGLRPLRYEKRVARNRFVALSILLLLVILGILRMLLVQR